MRFLVKYIQIMRGYMKKNFWKTEDCFIKDADNQYFLILLHKNYEIGTHYHEFYEMNIVVNGNGIHKIFDNEITVNKGDVFVIPPFVKHSYINCGELDVYHILIRNNFLEKFGSDLEEIPGFNQMFYFEPELRPISTQQHYLKLNFEDTLNLSVKLDQLLYMSNSKNVICTNIFATNLITELCLKINSSITNKATIMNIMEYINYNLSEKITLDTLSNTFHLSKSTLTRLFKKELNITPIDYLIKCRILRANTLIKTTEKNLSEIATECGFYDTSHMNKFIKN